MIVTSCCPYVRKLLTFHIFDFFSETSELNSTRLDMSKNWTSSINFVVFFSGRWENKDSRHCLWLADTVSTSSMKPLNGIWRNFTLSKNWTSFIEFAVFVANWKTTMAALASEWPRQVWDTLTYINKLLSPRNALRRGYCNAAVVPSVRPSVCACVRHAFTLWTR